MEKRLKFLLFYICVFFFFSSCIQHGNKVVENPAIIEGTSKITGRIVGPTGSDQDSIFIIIVVLHPISGEYVQHKVFVDRSGKFAIDVDVETPVSLIGLYTSINLTKSLLVKIKSGAVTNIDIVYNSDYEVKNLKVTPAGLTQNDMVNGVDVMNKMVDYRGGQPRDFLKEKSTDYLLNYVKTALSERLEIVKSDTLISGELKGILFRDFRLFLYSPLFDQQRQKRKNTGAVKDDKNKEPEIQKRDRSFYRFLKDFNLKDSQYLNCSTFPEFQRKILQNETLGLPRIDDSDIPSWLVKVKAVLSGLVGFNDGQYYDILAANAYGRQLNEEERPLTKKQKENITNYWKSGEIAKILLRKNKEVAELDHKKSPTIVNDVSSVPNNKVIESILSKQKGKVVFIDLWATWCVPCLDAMKQFRSTKAEFLNKGVAFVYITNGSSPRKLWEEKIKGIGSEQYYLTGSQWEYITNHFAFEGIPSYLLYNKEGVLIKKFTGFPGKDQVKDMITRLL